MIPAAELQYFADITDELLAVTLVDGSFVACNAAWGRLLGHDEAALRAIRLPALTTVDARDALFGLLALAAVDRSGTQRLVPLRAADGSLHTFELVFTGGEDGRVYLRGRRLRGAATGAEQTRAELLTQVIDTAPCVLWKVDRDGTFVMSEGGGLATLGLQPGQVVGRSAFEVYRDAPSVLDGLRRGLAGEESLSRSAAGERHFANFTRPLRDEAGVVTGLMGLAIDITGQVRAEEAVREQAERLEQQRELLQVMGMPILQVWDGVLCVPVIGTVDGARASAITEAVLSAVSQRSAQIVILDLTGLEACDGATAMHFVRIVSALRLLGARSFVVGIGPALAQVLVELQVELQVETLGTLQDALRRCLTDR